MPALSKARQVSVLADTIVSVKDFGAVGDGVTDDTAAIQTAIDASIGKTLFFPASTYRITAGLNVSNPLLLSLDPSATIDFSSATAGTVLGQKSAITFSGSIGSDVDATASIQALSKTIALISTSGLAVNDWIAIRSDDPYAVGGSAAYATLGNISRIRTVDSGTQLTTWEPSPFDYTESLNLRVAKLTLLEKSGISGGRILCGGTGSVHTAIRFNYCEQPTCKDVEIEGAEDAAITFLACVSPSVETCNINRSTSVGGAIGNTGYGIAVYGGKGGSANSNHFFNCRHAVAGGAGNGLVSVGFEFSSNSVFGCGFASALTWAVDCHEPCYNWKFIGNTIAGCHGGAVLRGPGTVFLGNTIRDVEVSAIQIQQFQTNTVGLPRIIVKDNIIENSGTYGINAQGHQYGTDKILDVVISGNIIRSATNHAIFLDFAFGVTLSDNLVFETKGTNRNGILIRNSERIVVQGGRVDATGDTNGNPITIDTSSRVTVHGVQIRGSSVFANQDGIRSQNATGTNNSIIITNNCISNCSRYGIHITGSDRVIVTNNDVRDVVSATKVLLTGVTSSVNTNNII